MLVQILQVSKQPMTEIALPVITVPVVCELISLVLRRAIPPDFFLGDDAVGILATHEFV